jgi:cob(I)alamin adenosyltransferase
MKMKKKFKGYIQIYTGNGKGKTTAALGLALRAAGYNIRVFIGQFIKGHKYGELHSLKKLDPLITIRQFGRKGFIHITDKPDKKDIEAANKGLNTCLEAMLSGKYEIIILDEINVALYFNLLSEKQVHDFLDKKPDGVEIVMTGRYSPPSFIDRADLVTEMNEKKHYFNTGIQARKGIEK